jgi:hypothetical protein
MYGIGACVRLAERLHSASLVRLTDHKEPSGGGRGLRGKVGGGGGEGVGRRRKGKRGKQGE